MRGPLRWYGFAHNCHRSANSPPHVGSELSFQRAAVISMRRKQGRTPILQISNSPKRSRAGLATKKGNEELNARATFKFHCIKYLGRIRLVVFVLFCMIVAGLTVLYFDSLTCWLRSRPTPNSGRNGSMASVCLPTPAFKASLKDLHDLDRERL